MKPNTLSHQPLLPDTPLVLPSGEYLLSSERQEYLVFEVDSQAIWYLHPTCHHRE
jgi:hypothetical protein